MPDITMCSGFLCPLKDKCYRCTATPSAWQSYFSKPPFDKDKGTCDYFSDNHIYNQLENIVKGNELDNTI